ncbi:hypothetical protein [Streptomyces xiaopingdaonensis]|uniref:hypothetical protein n=1 Tax=Streptomyces xiaopingdaonensis TaxID=1565415 RepID=UPI0003169454|nr:hypothetical protein [Streptomyces xiaopingdaonensis]
MTEPTTAHPAVGPGTLTARLRRRVPELGVALDEWTRRMMRWHFDPATGSPFWVARRDRLGFDPVHDLTGFADLHRFGLFDKEELRGARVADLRPRGYRDRPFRVFETGGTTGRPCRIVNVTRLDYDVEIYRTVLEERGLAGGDILAMTPSGPHAYGHFVEALADSWRGAVHAIDFDPRWVKSVVRSGDDADAYTGHLIDQALPLLEERPALLFTTSRLLLELAVRLPRPLHSYGVQAVCTGGISCTPAEAAFLREEYLNGVQWIDTYGNTLVGHALQADPMPDGPRLPEGADRSYHLPPPFAVLTVVEPDDPWREVPYGARGRIRTTTLLEDLFLPNLLERDSAVRVGPHPWFPWDGVALVRSFDGSTEETGHDAAEGVY